MKQDNFTRDDLLHFAKHCNLTTRQGSAIIDEVRSAFADFPRLAEEYGVSRSLTNTVEAFQRINSLGPAMSAPSNEIPELKL